MLTTESDALMAAFFSWQWLYETGSLRSVFPHDLISVGPIRTISLPELSVLI